ARPGDRANLLDERLRCLRRAGGDARLLLSAAPEPRPPGIGHSRRGIDRWPVEGGVQGQGRAPAVAHSRAVRAARSLADNLCVRSLREGSIRPIGTAWSRTAQPDARPTAAPAPA